MADGWGIGPGRDGGHARKRRGSDFLFYPDNSAEMLRIADTRLLADFPQASCKLGITDPQKRILKRSFAITGLMALIAPTLLLSLASLLAYLVFAIIMLQRGLLIYAGAFSTSWLDPERALLKGQIWPVYSVLVPVYREPKAVPNLVSSLKVLDYPKRQLDIIILLEEDDEETLEVLTSLALKPCFRIVRVPAGDVKTKPRALNYGLQLAKGQYIAIYDAEDQMHSGQLKAAVRALQQDRIDRGVPPRACVQAPLVPHNPQESWVAGQFALEYGVQFGLIVPGLTQLRLPVPLGGTSNHFDRGVLEEIGGWDPNNVTEDADLGLRLACAGYRVGSISPPTYEEAPIGLTQWVKQRSRWIKGYIQTLGVFLRSPGRGVDTLGAWRFLNAVTLVGGSIVSALFHGPLLIWLVLCACLPGIGVPPVALGLLVGGLLVHALAAGLSFRCWSWTGVVSLISAPLYWPLQSLAAAKAIYELFTAPFYWDKTEHGVSEGELARQSLR